MHTVVELLVVDVDTDAAWAWDEYGRGKNDVLVDEMDEDVRTEDLVDETNEDVKTDDLVDETGVRAGACDEVWEDMVVQVMLEDGVKDVVQVWLVVTWDCVNDRAKFTPGSDDHLVRFVRLGNCDSLLLKEKM